MKSNTYIIRCISNLHVGGEGENYGAIDKLVQRDTATKFPTIHGSGIKGALREQCKSAAYEEAVFGGDPKKNEHKAGTYNFHDALLLALPVRSNVQPYFMATSKSLIMQFVNHCELFHTGSTEEAYIPKDLITAISSLLKNTSSDCSVFNQGNYDNIILEDWVAKNEVVAFSNEEKEALKKVFGENIAILSHAKLQELSENLPVIARNYLENGKSENLWYEEVVPRETRFYTMIQRKEKDIKKEFDDKLSEGIKQLGAHATIGYGQTKFTKL